MLVYMATNKTTGKSYVGITKNSLQARKNSHWKSVLKGSQTQFHKALRQYKLNGFSWKTLEKCKTIEEMQEREIHYISEYKTYEFGYNMTKGGEYFSPQHDKRNSCSHKVWVRKEDIILLNKIYDGNRERIFSHFFPSIMSNVNVWLSRLIDSTLDGLPADNDIPEEVNKKYKVSIE